MDKVGKSEMLRTRPPSPQQSVYRLSPLRSSPGIGYWVSFCQSLGIIVFAVFLFAVSATDFKTFKTKYFVFIIDFKAY